MRQLPLLAIVLLLLTACGNSPKNVAKQYWQGLIDEDSDAVAEAASENSQRELWRIVSPQEGSQVSFGETKTSEEEDDSASVETRLLWLDKDSDEPVELNLYTILEKENDQWKVNTRRTRQQFFTAVYRTSLQGLSSALAEQLAEFQVLGEQAAEDFTNQLDRTIDELKQQSEQANEDIQTFLEQLDQELQEELNSINR